MRLYDFIDTDSPVLISIPHAGLEVPTEILSRFTPEARLLADTDWHVDRLYDFAPAMGCSMLTARYSRYVIDLNRPPDDANLYPGRDTTGLVPVDTFAGQPIYIDDMTPDMAETFGRIDGFWRPYHDKIAQALDAIRARHGYAILWEAHSIRSQVPRLFDGRLPDLSFGTVGGRACAESLADIVTTAASHPSGAAYSQTRDGRFKGGYNTRHYGRPKDNIHAIQLEIAQATYMDERPPFPFDEPKADQLRASLRAMLQAALDWRPGA
jgi:N-formylglutamate amidohydrolase